MEMKRRIIITEGEPAPQFEGQWTVGDVLAMAESLGRWAQSLTVSQPVQQPPETAKENEHEKQ